MVSFSVFRWGDKSCRVLHCPSVVGGNATTLSRALDRTGTPSISVAYDDHRFGYHPDVILWSSEFGIFRRELIRLMAVFRVVLGYEVIHFNFGTTMAMPSFPLESGSAPRSLVLLRGLHYLATEALQVCEVFLLKMFRRRVFVTFQGDDARQGDKSLQIFSESIAHHVGTLYYSERTDRIKRRRIRRIEGLAAEIFYVNPDLAHFLPKRARFIPYSHIEIPREPITDRLPFTRPLRVVHAPSSRDAKGTRFVVTAIEDLRASGHDIELDLIEAIPHDEMRARLRGASLLIDQLFAGWYGGIAVEAMASGVPVMTFLRYADFDVVPHAMIDELPILPTSKETLRADLLHFLLQTPEERKARQSSGISFVNHWHDPEDVAREIASFYQV
jgi:hypothetical protein